MALSTEETRTRYRSLAGCYDVALWGYRLVGARIGRDRQREVDRLSLRSGDTVIDLGCGTGLNFSRLHETVGPDGHMAILELKRPEGWPAWLVRLNKPFGVSVDYADRHPWTSIRRPNGLVRSTSVPCTCQWA